jgi:hypothetical protein
MAFDKKTNTITVGENSDFLVDSGVFFLDMLRKNSLAADAPTAIKDDWSTVKNWLGFDNNITSSEEEKLSKAWKSYLAIGCAPSFKLQSAFDQYAQQYKESGYSFKEHKAPSEVMDVFDRLLATDSEISAKRNHDWAEEKRKLDAVFKNFPKKKRSLKQKISSLSKNSRILIASSITWFFWVVFRTSDDWEILGIYLDNWDDDTNNKATHFNLTVI